MQVFSDVARDSTPDAYVRGWSKICFVLINFIVVWLIVCRNQRRFFLYGIGLAAGTLLSFYIHPSDDALISPWIFAIGIPVTMLVVLWASYFDKRRYFGIVSS